MSVAGIAGIHYQEPGIDGLIATFENTIFDGDSRYWNFWKLQQELISGTTRDLGNTPTTELRPGLVMAFDTSINKWVHYVPGGLNGTGKVSGFLFAAIQTQKDGADQDRFVTAIAWGGHIKARGIIISNAANTSPGLVGSTGEATFRADMLADMPWARLSDFHTQ